MSRTFHIGAVISAAGGPLCTDGGIGDVYDVLGFLVGDKLWTHQLPTASRTAEPYLLEQFPWLSEVQTRPDDWPDTFASDDEARRVVTAWRDRYAEKYGTWIELEQLPPHAWGEPHNPFDDLVMLVGDKPIIPVVIVGDDPEPTP